MTGPCERWRHVAAVAALSGPDSAEGRALAEHQRECANCRHGANEFAEVVAALGEVDATVLSDDAVPAELAAALAGALTRARRRRRAQGALAAVTLAVALAVALALSGGPAPPTRRLALAGRVANANVQLSAEPWGTRVQLSESGLSPGIYTVSMETKTGRWWTTGSYRSRSGGSVAVTMTCAVALERIAGVRVVNARGTVVLSAGPSRTTTTY